MGGKPVNLQTTKPRSPQLAEPRSPKSESSRPRHLGLELHFSCFAVLGLVFWFFGFMVLFIFTGGLQKNSQFVATIPRVEMIGYRVSRRCGAEVEGLSQRSESLFAGSTSNQAWVCTISSVNKKMRLVFANPLEQWEIAGIRPYVTQR